MEFKLGKCPCGRPWMDEIAHPHAGYVLDYVGRIIREQRKPLPETIIVTRLGRHFRVNRYYLGLHGLKARDLDDLAARGIVEEVK